MRKLYRWFLARFRLNLRVVCEESVGLDMWNDYHDYPDTEHQMPDHFTVMRCKRCGKEFTI
jgi:hypothetical protein